MELTWTHPWGCATELTDVKPAGMTAELIQKSASWRWGDATELPHGEPAKMISLHLHTALGGTATLTAAKPIGALLDLTAKTSTGMLLKIDGDEFHWMSYMPAWHRKSKYAGMRTGNRRHPYLLQCLSSALYCQSVTSCQLARDKCFSTTRRHWRMDLELRSNKLITVWHSAFVESMTLLKLYLYSLVSSTISYVFQR